MLTDRVDLPEFGPAMKSLNEKQRRFVYEMLQDPFAKHNEWAKRAGYSDTGGGDKVIASRMLQSPKVQAAVYEMARGHFSAIGPMLAAAGLLRIAADPEHKDHFRALESVADRVGLPKLTEHRVTVDDGRNDPLALIERVKELAGQLGVDPKRLLGAGVKAPKVIEHIEGDGNSGRED